VVGTQDLFFFASRIVGGSARILDEAAPAGSAAVALPSLSWCTRVEWCYCYCNGGNSGFGSFRLPSCPSVYPDNTSGTATAVINVIRNNTPVTLAIF
jgi:hypothetical protein